MRRTILYVFDIEPPSDDPKAIEDTFNQYVEEEELDGQTIYVVKEDGETKAYAFPIGGTGLWGGQWKDMLLYLLIIVSF